MTNKFFKQLKILFVEDESKLSELLENAIGDNFGSFICAYNGKDGLKKFKEFLPDIVITDITMPIMSGLDMAREIKNISPDTPIIILSAYSETDKLLNAIDIGVIKYFIKPFDLDEVLEYIDSLKTILEKKTVKLYDDFLYKKDSNTLYKNNRYIKLSKTEKEFFKLMINENKENHIISSETIKLKLWGNSNVSNDRVRTFIKRLREKTSKDVIKNIKGEGYQLYIL